MESADLLLEPRWLVRVAPDCTAHTGQAVAVRDGRIAAVGPAGELGAHFQARQRVSLAEHVLLPGLVNLHTHAAMALMRGIADDLPLMAWLKEHIWPAEARHVSREFVHEGTLLACAEMLRGGVTCFNDMYFFPEAAARAVLESGMRAALGLIVLEFPTAYAGDPEDYLNKGFAIRDSLRREPLLSFCLAPHAPYTVSDRSFERILTYAEQLELPIHVHLHETAEEIHQSEAQHGMRPLARLHRLGLLGPNLIAVHAVHLSAEEIALLGRQGCHVAHCPSSNLKLASGFAPVAALVEAGVGLGLGTDGAASNNRLDLFTEMRLAALLGKAVSGRADALPAAQALHAATLGGAAALGLEREIGSIEPGKAADLAAVDLSDLATLPCYDPVSHLVYAAGREQVSHVWVNGELLLEEGRHTRLDTARLTALAARWGRRLAS